MEPTERTQTRPDGTTFTPKLIDGMEFLQQWRRENLNEYDQVVEFQRQQDSAEETQADTADTNIQAEGASEPGSTRNKVTSKKDSTR